MPKSTQPKSFYQLMHREKSFWLNVQDVKNILGDNFNPISDSRYCLSGDGEKVIRSNDYYVGNLATLINELDTGIINAKDNDPLINALRGQRDEAKKRVNIINPRNLTYTLFSPYVKIDEVVEFVRQYINPRTSVITNDKGKRIISIGVKTPKTDQEKIDKRFGFYLQNRTKTLGSTKFSEITNDDALMILNKMASRANTQFDTWVKASPDIMARLNAIAANPENLELQPLENEYPLYIKNIRAGTKLHGCQNSFVRQSAIRFEGINGFDVGLGKTLASLAAVQHSHNLGSKTKTFFVIPNVVLSNWKKEVAKFYNSDEGTLFVGLRVGKDGREVIKSSMYDNDLSLILENKHSKIFLTYEAFQSLRMKDESIVKFSEYMKRNDSSYKGSVCEDGLDILFKGSLAVLKEKKKLSTPYFEDLGVDSIVIDEAHAFKNASRVSDFKGAKFLSLPSPAKRSLDAHAKCWFVRDKSRLNDGVILLTATPITNSPLEMYSMLALAKGHEKINKTCLSISAADEFMEAVSSKETEANMSIDGVSRVIDVFTGLNSSSILRKSINEAAVIKNASDLGGQIIVPDSEIIQNDIDLKQDIVDLLQTYKKAFRYVLDQELPDSENRGDEVSFNKVAEKFGINDELIGHPFNLLRSMELLVMDQELDDRATFFTFLDEQLELVETVIGKFNALKINTLKLRKNPFTREHSVIGEIFKPSNNQNGGDTWLKIRVEAYLIDSSKRIVIDTIDTIEITRFEVLAEKSGLALSITIPHKIEALLDNVSNEIASPRGLIKDDEGNVVASPIVKQIIFCDILPMHNKIRKALTERLGIPSSKIATLTGKTNSDACDVLEVQEGFNANGDDNRYQIVLANKKAEIGINLQIGSQAVHHVTIGWTPDSLHQRIGRIKRQGNLTKKVNVYFCDANGTFDKQKRVMVERKAEWIDDLIYGDSSEIEIKGGMSKEELELLIDCVGNEGNMQKVQAAANDRANELKVKNNRDKQLINLDTIIKQRDFLQENKNEIGYLATAILELNGLIASLVKLSGRPAKTKLAKAKNDLLIEGLDNSIKTISNDITCNYKMTGWSRKISASSLSEYSDLNSLRRCLSKIDIEIIPGGSISNRYHRSVELSKNLIEESVIGFKDKAKQKGAFPLLVLDAVMNDSVSMFDSVPLFLGTFIINNKKPEQVTIVTKIKGAVVNVLCISEGGIFQGKLSYGTLDYCRTTYEGTVEHSEIAKKLAKMEDSLEDVQVLYSDYSKEVLSYRAFKLVDKNCWQDYRLPTPYFPVILGGDVSIELHKKLKKHQSEVVTVIANGNALVARSVGDKMKVITGFEYKMGKYSNDYDVAFRMSLFDYAKANNIKLKECDLTLPVAGSPSFKFKSDEGLDFIYIVSDIENLSFDDEWDEVDDSELHAKVRKHLECVDLFIDDTILKYLLKRLEDKYI